MKNRTHTYVMKNTYVSTDWHDAHSESVLLLESNQPYIYDIRTVILANVYQHIPAEEHRFLADCFDHKITGSKEQPATITHFSNDTIDEQNQPKTEADCITPDEIYIKCYWLEDTFSVIIEYDCFDYTLYFDYVIQEYADDNIVFVPIASWYIGIKYGDTQDRMFTTQLFDNYKDAVKWTKQFEERYHYGKLDYNKMHIIFLEKDKLEFDAWYRVQKAILTKTSGFNQYFMDKFCVDAKGMYTELIGEKNFEKLIANIEQLKTSQS